MFAFIAVFAFTALSFGQQAKAATSVEVAKSKTTGVYTFTLPATLVEDDVNNTAKIYTHYFTVVYTPTTNNAVITMVENDDRSRHVIARFFVALGVKEIMLDGKAYTPEEFYVGHMQ